MGALLKGVTSTTFTFNNNCPFTVWPGTPHGGSSQLGNGATSMWARTGCTTDASGRFFCQTGNCGIGIVSCSGARGAPPVTLLQYALQGDGGKDFYGTSLVDGFNLPTYILSKEDRVIAKNLAASVDINARCRAQLQLKNGDGAVVGCKNAYLAFNTDEAFGTPSTCKPSNFSMSFKCACHDAYSYAYDDASSTFTCTGNDYLITFCP